MDRRDVCQSQAGEIAPTHGQRLRTKIVGRYNREIGAAEKVLLREQNAISPAVPNG